jgi:L-asparaginase
MRPATSSEADGPRNLRDAVWVAGHSQAHGVLAVCAGDVHHALAVQKVHTYALNAFSSGDAALGELGVIAQVLGEQVLWKPAFSQVSKENQHVAVIEYAQRAINLIVNDSAQKLPWARVEVVLNHAQASGSIVRALLAASSNADPLRGIVVAGTGNGTVSESLQSALDEAQSKGVEVVIASRCAWGGIHDASALSAVKTRIELMLKLLSA